MENDLVSRWEKSGLLEGIHSLEDRQILSKNLDDAVNHITRIMNATNDNDYLYTFTLPIIRKVFDVHKHIDVKDIIIELIRYHKEKYHLYSELHSSPIATDFDKLFCEYFYKHYSNTWKQRLIIQKFGQNKI